MSICETCRTIDFKSLELDCEYPFFGSGGELLSSAESCPICKIIADGLTNPKYYGPKPLNNSLSVSFMVEKDAFGPHLHFFSRTRNSGFRSVISSTNVGLYTEEELCSGTWMDRIRRFCESSQCDKAFEKLNDWIGGCLKYHSECTQTLSSEQLDENVPPKLPSRIIDVGPQDGSKLPHLIQNNCSSDSSHLTGFYAALSYCWGDSKLDRSYMTTKSSLRDRCDGIQWDTLPKTFQDAIMVTRRIGLKYLWIDALCIIQSSEDDKDDSDWCHELENMGSIYERARLVIAAAHGKDPFDGLFPDRPEINSFRHSESSPIRIGKIWSLNMFDYHPRNSHLNSRAWATQEWILARRIVYYTKEKLAWSCKARRDFEYDDGKFDSIMKRDISWPEIITRYSKRHLTRPQDKLRALEGIEKEVKKTRPNDLYVTGLWWSDMPFGLLWHSQTRLSPGPEELDIPTWSWASRVGEIGFSFGHKNILKKDMEMVWLDQGKLSLRENRFISLRGRLKVFNNDFHPFPGGEHGAPRLEEAGITFISDFPSSLIYRLVEPGVVFLACTQAKEATAFLVVDDQGVPSSGKNLRISYMHVDGDCNMHDRGELSFLEIMRCKKPDGSEAFVAGLLLSPANVLKKFYRRVGMGIASTSWFNDAEEESDITLI